MRRLSTAVAVSLALGTAGADAAVLRGTDAADRLLGTRGSDAAYGLGGRDLLDGRAGADFLHGGPDSDLLLGRGGPDRIAAALDAAPDVIRCGAGADVVTAEGIDSVAADCELVVRQVSRDTTTDSRAQHETQVEPDSAANGRTVVTVFQSGRQADGGAAGIGWATSTNAGGSWRSGFLPGVTMFSTPPGESTVATDPVVAWDAAHGTWLAVTLGISEAGMSFMVSRSPDGLRWDLPITALRAPEEAIDKEWVTCDNGPRSPYRGTCYIAYLDVEAGYIAVIRSSDGGRTWSAPVGSRAGIPVRGIVNGALPEVLPNGTLVVVFSLFGVFADMGADQVLAMRSRDGGRTFEPARHVALLPGRGRRGRALPALRLRRGRRRRPALGRVAGLPLPHRVRGERDRARVDRGRRRLVEPGARPDRDTAEGVDAFVPGLAADPAGRGRLGLVYHTVDQPGACPPDECRAVHVWVTGTRDGGRTWARPRRLTPRGMRLPWIAQTGIGRMLADYVSASWTGGRTVAVISLADEPVDGAFRQATFAAAFGV